ncbi:hypothetical protein ACLKA6_010662 [Drosophila palustris]
MATANVAQNSSLKTTTHQLQVNNPQLLTFFLDYYAAQIVCGLVPEWMHMCDLFQNLLATTTIATTASKNI